MRAGEIGRIMPPRCAVKFGQKPPARNQSAIMRHRTLVSGHSILALAAIAHAMPAFLPRPAIARIDCDQLVERFECFRNLSLHPLRDRKRIQGVDIVRNGFENLFAGRGSFTQAGILQVRPRIAQGGVDSVGVPRCLRQTCHPSSYIVTSNCKTIAALRASGAMPKCDCGGAPRLIAGAPNR